MNSSFLANKLDFDFGFIYILQKFTDTNYKDTDFEVEKKTEELKKAIVTTVNKIQSK